MSVDKSEIARLTEKNGGQWGINHTRRLLKLVDEIGAGMTYDADVIWIAAHLHDWGAYAPWARKGVDHTERSVQVADEYLRISGCDLDLRKHILECISLHHTPDAEGSLEATLLRDADALDFLGVIGVLRDFSKNPRDMRSAFEQVRKRREKVPPMLRTARARIVGAQRVERMDELLVELEAESFGCF